MQQIMCGNNHKQMIENISNWHTISNYCTLNARICIICSTKNIFHLFGQHK